MKFHRKVTIVTGGSTGIGLATCNELILAGATVYNLDINPKSSNESHFLQCNITDYEQVKKAVQEVFEREGQIDLLFANAGVHLFANIEETSKEQLDNIIDTNIKGIFYTLKEVIPLMKKQRNGKIVLMGSDQSLVGKAQSSAYGMTKGAIGQLAKSIAIDYAPFNIQVNCICPGTIDTPLLEKAVGRLKELTDLSKNEIDALLNNAQPMGRIAQPIEIAKTVCFLLSEDNSFMTGSLISVDGGYTCQ
jgi:NAD(P)-dependent dehydrogenase (short-subunit alcohol dehydrogenase family)